jgi:hypothetical protein
MFYLSSRRRFLYSILQMAILAACATDASREAFRHTETELEAAREQAAIECSTPGDCAQAWNAALAFVRLHSPTPIERITDETIETRTPHEFGVAYYWAARRTADDGTMTIRLKGMCRGMYSTDGGPGWNYRRCAAQLREAQLEFARELGAIR